MERQAGRTENRMASATAFHMILAQSDPAVGAFLAGRSPKKIATILLSVATGGLRRFDLDTR